MTPLLITNNWPMKPLRQVAVIERSGVAPENISSGTNYIGLEHIDSSGAFVSTPSVENGELASTKFRFGPEHVLYGKLRPYLKKIARPSFEGVCSTDILPIRPKKGTLDKDYLFYVLRQQGLIDLAMTRSTGANLPRISPKALGEFPIPLPPLEEQKRIAAILDKADGIRRKRQQAMAMADEFLRSVFLDMFGDPVTNPKRWKTEEMKNIGKVTTGNTPSRSIPEYYGDSIEWIKSDNINTPSHYLTKATEGLSLKGKAVGRTVGKDAILVTCIAGSPDCIGNLALAGREVAFNQQINALETNDKVDALFMYSQLMVGKRLIQKASTNSMKGMVSKGKFELIPVMVPPMDMQLQFSRIFCKQMKMVQNMELHTEQGERSFSALAQELFSGRIN